MCVCVCVDNGFLEEAIAKRSSVEGEVRTNKIGNKYEDVFLRSRSFRCVLGMGCAVAAAIHDDLLFWS